MEKGASGSSDFLARAEVIAGNFAAIFDARSVKARCSASSEDSSWESNWNMEDCCDDESEVDKTRLLEPLVVFLDSLLAFESFEYPWTL